MDIPLKEPTAEEVYQQMINFIEKLKQNTSEPEAPSVLIFVKKKWVRVN